MRIDQDVEEAGVRRRLGVVAGARGDVPTAIWSPEATSGACPVVLVAHGGTQHKLAPSVVRLAESAVVAFGALVVAIDAPHHGDRITREQAEAARARARRGDPTRPRYRGEPSDPYPGYLLEGVADWGAVLDEVAALPEADPTRVGWWGLSMGTSIGIPFVATEPSVTCAVLGLASTIPRPGLDDYLGWARAIQVPLLFLCQRDDGGHPVALALELFDLFGSAERTMHLNPGPHVGVPRHEVDASIAFLGRHLVPATSTAPTVPA